MGGRPAVRSVGRSLRLRDEQRKPGGEDQAVQRQDHLQWRQVEQEAQVVSACKRDEREHNQYDRDQRVKASAVAVIYSVSKPRKSC